MHFWHYSKEETDVFSNATANTNGFNSFTYKTKLIGSTATAIGILENPTIALPL